MFASPVVRTYARQVRFVAEAMAGSRTLPDSPPMTLRLLARAGRGRVSRVRRVVRRGQLRPAGARPADRREPGATRRGDSRNRPSGGLCVRRVADVRRLVVARPHQPAVRHRGARSRHQREADDRPARHAGEGVRPARLPHGRADARSASELAGRRVLRIQRDLRRRTPRLPGARVRLVRPSGSVLARALRRARGGTRIGWPALRLLSDDQHTLSVQADAAVSAGLAAHADPRSRTTDPKSCAHTRTSRTGPTSGPVTSKR